MKGFYLGLAAIAVIGVVALVLARRAGSGGVQTVEPVAVAAGSFAGHVLGSDSAPVTIVEYADFECPACAQFAVLTGPDIKQRLVATGRVRWVFRDFPLEQHRNAMPAHLAAACAGEQGQFWAMHDQLFFNHGRWVTEGRPERRIRDLASALPLDMRQYDDCMDSGRYRGRIQATRQEALSRGVQSTPTLEINTLRVAGALLYDSLRVLVDRAAGASR